MSCSKNTPNIPNIDADELAKRAELLQEKCGVFGVLSNRERNSENTLDVAQLVCLGLVGLQHRGQEAAGLVVSSANQPLGFHRGNGQVSQVFTDESVRQFAGADIALGHTRYSTKGGQVPQLAQPFIVHTSYGTLSVAHNGELVNSGSLREKIMQCGVGLSTGSDSELITQCLSLPPPDEFTKSAVDYLINLPKPEIDYDHNYLHMRNRTATLVLPDGKSLTEKTLAQTRPQRQHKCKGSCNDVTNGNGYSGNGNHHANHHVLQLKSLSFDERRHQENTELDNDAELLSRLLHFMSLTPLSYSLAIIYNNSLYALRDPFGNRPLTIGMVLPPPTDGIQCQLTENQSIDGWVVSSESCSFAAIGAKIYRDVEPGEIVKLQRNHLPVTLARVTRPHEDSLPAMCIFEYVYFARADSIIEGQMVYTVRMRCGEQLSVEAPVPFEPDNHITKKVIVSAVPESSIPAALGFSQKSGVPYMEVFSKNRYVGRTFIQPSTRLRRLGVAKKFGPLSGNVEGKTIILIDDSIVRGTTIGQLIRLLKEAGAKEVHIRIASPPLHYPCNMGINIPTKEELIANQLNNVQLAHSLGASSLVYLSIDGLKESVQSGIRDLHKKNNVNKPIGHCTACLTGSYPVEIEF